MPRNFNITAPLARTIDGHPERVAFAIGKDEWSYAEFGALVRPLADRLRPLLRSKRVGVLGTRSIEGYVGIAAAAWAGGTYVPLNLKWPEARLIELMGQLQLDALVVDANGERLLTSAVRRAAPTMIFGPDQVREIAREGRAMEAPAYVDASHTAYVIFTSGTTGTPKGVVVSCGSLDLYLDATEQWTQFTADDRVAEAHDLTFDLSVHNTFLAWSAGAAVHVMSPLDMMAPQRFIRSREITCWMSVPTLVAMMRATKALKPDIFPSLRLSVFCGEPLPMPAVRDWALAAPLSTIDNIYGPTECTVVCTRERLSDPARVTASRNILAIGDAYPGFTIRLLDADQREVSDGEIGEIALASAQLSDGYFAAPEQTADRFRTIDGRRFYLTGDLGVRDAAGVLHHMGRADNQVKLKGNRIELEEVEMHLRRAAETELACVVAWPVIDGSAQALVGFVAGRVDEGSIQSAMAEALPRYMVPSRIRPVAELPRNANGKIDRNALKALLEHEVDAPAMTTPDEEVVDA